MRHYLKAVEAAKTDDAVAVAAKMRELPVARHEYRERRRPRGWTGHARHVYLVGSRSPTNPSAWDYYKVLTTVPADQAFQALADSACPAVGKQ